MPLPPDILALTRRVADEALDAGPPWEEATQRAEGLIPAVLAAQRAHIPTVARFLSAQGIPADAPWWRQAVPTDLFRAARLFAGSEDAVAHTFASSGTTDPTRRSLALFSQEGLTLMERSIFTNARRMLFPEGTKSRILVLAPSPALAPPMIMAWGMARLIEAFGLPGSGFLIDEGGLDPQRVVVSLRSACDDGAPVTLIGASFAFVHLLDFFVSQGITFKLPPGSRTLDAGGFKGRSREIAPEALRASISEALGIPPARAVNLLGMTELASQLYDDALAADHGGWPGRGAKIPPPWARTVAVDPGTLEPCPEGEVGLLVHLDLANVERPAAIRTSDLGRVVPGGFQILGRDEGAAAAGCSLTVEELIRRGGGR